MKDSSRQMTAEEFCTLFHEAHHLRVAEACMQMAEMYWRCDQIEENVRCALLRCRLARTFYSGPAGYNDFKKRSGALMRAAMKELDDEAGNLVRNALFIFTCLNLSLEELRGPANVDDQPDEANEHFKGLDEVPAGKLKEQASERSTEEPGIGIKLDGHGGSDVCLSAEAWEAYLNAAKSCGWQPHGTRAPPFYQGAWNGSYSLPECQTVEDEDARCLSMGLDRLIDAVRSGEEMTQEQLEAVKQLERFDKDLSGAQELADYALEGSFTLWRP